MSAYETISIPESRLIEALGKLEKLNKRADKLNLPKVEFNVSESYTKREPRYDSNSPMYDPTDKVERSYIDLSYTTETVKVEGFEAIATYEFNRDVPSVFVWPGKTVPKKYLTITTECEHCKRSRKRSRVFLLRKVSSGRYKRVGSTCVKDFIGHNPDQMLNQLKWLKQIKELDGDDWKLSSGKQHLDVSQIVLLSVAMVREHGYTSRQQEENGNAESTVSLVDRWFNNRPNKYETFPKVSDADKLEAIKVVETVKGINPNNAYTHNLKNIADSGFATWREFGLTVSMVVFAMREQNKTHENRKRNADIANSQWIGKVKDKVTVKAKLTMERRIDSYYGTSTLLKWDSDGNVLTWFATNPPDVAIGETVTLMGTIKKLSEYQGIKETTLTRCKVS